MEGGPAPGERSYLAASQVFPRPRLQQPRSLDVSVGSLQPSVDTSRDTLDLAIRAASSLTLGETSAIGRELRRPTAAREEGDRD